MNTVAHEEQGGVDDYPQAEPILVFAPTYNERGSIASLLDGIFALPLATDVLIIDDSSTDGTTEYLQERRRTDQRLKLIVRPRKLGIGSAHKTAWAYAREKGYTFIVTLDADLSHDPAAIPQLVGALRNGAQVAVGSRFAPGGMLDYTGWRRVVSVTGNRFIARLLGLPLREYTTSFRAARLGAVPPGLVERIRSDDYSFFVSCVVAFARTNLRIVEVPIRFHNRHGGASKLSRHALIAGVLNVLRLAIDRRSPHIACNAGQDGDAAATRNRP